MAYSDFRKYTYFPEGTEVFSKNFFLKPFVMGILLRKCLHAFRKYTYFTEGIIKNIDDYAKF